MKGKINGLKKYFIENQGIKVEHFNIKQVSFDGKTTNSLKCAVFWKGGFGKISEEYGAFDGLRPLKQLRAAGTLFLRGSRNLRSGKAQFFSQFFSHKNQIKKLLLSAKLMALTFSFASFFCVKAKEKKNKRK